MILHHAGLSSVNNVMITIKSSRILDLDWQLVPEKYKIMIIIWKNKECDQSHTLEREGVYESDHMPFQVRPIAFCMDTGCCVYDSVILYDHIYIYLVDHPQFFYQTQR